MGIRTIRTKMLLMFISMVILAVAIIAIFSYQNVQRLLAKEASNKLTAIRDIKKREIEGVFLKAGSDMKWLIESISSGQTEVKEKSSAARSRKYDKYVEIYGYEDLMMIDAEGNCFYTARKGAEYQTNLLTGQYKDSNLARIFKQVIDSKTYGIADFEPYAPNNNEPAAFIAQPMVLDSKVEVVLALELSLTPINNIMQRDDGMGQAGESYLVGQDYFLRSDARLGNARIKVFDSLTKKVKMGSSSITKALAGTTGLQIINATGDGKKHDIISSYAPLKVGNTTWAIISEADIEEVTAPARSLRNWAIVISLSLILVLGGVIYYFSTTVSTPVITLAEKAKALAAGDLTTQLNFDRRDEIGQLSLSLGDMVESWRSLIKSLSYNASRLSSASSEIAAAVEEMSRGADSQALQVVRTSSAMEEMALSIQQVSQNAKSTSESAILVSVLAKAGRAKVKESISGISLANESIKKLNQRVQQIGQVVQLIREIAAQTNILALNAAIEAARAGEYGRGFDVVAEEIRKLSQRTTQSTGEITASIEEIQKETQEAVVTIERGTAIVNEAGQALEDIVKDIIATRDMVHMISATATQQAKTSGEIADSLQQISSISKQTAQASKEVAKSTLDLTDMAEQLKTITEDFRA